MKRILTVIAVILGLWIAQAVVRAAFISPKQLKIERSLAVSAPPEKIFPHINDLRAFDKWNPWSKADPNIKQTFDGPAEGVDASSGWDGDQNVGKGRMTIVASEPPRLVKMRLDFEEPFAGTSHADFTLVPEGPATTVTWAMTNEPAFVPRVMCALLMMNMEKMMSEQFDKGLASLKAIAEAP